MSSVEAWVPLRRFVESERKLGAWAARRRPTLFIYEFIRFGLKQAWACLFGGFMVGLMLLTAKFWSADAPLQRYDFLFLAAALAQVLLLALKFETWEEALVIAIYHAVGTAMELFKTGQGSWLYPEPAFFKIGAVPLFSGFMYASIGSYLVRAWRLFDFKFTHHPPVWALALLSAGIYVNFFSHHYMVDFRPALFAAAALLFGRCWIYYRIWKMRRSMPLLLGLFLVSLFIWLAENVGTFTKTWLYPHQVQGWAMVSLGKLGAWFLLLIISYTLVALVHRPQALAGVENTR